MANPVTETTTLTLLEAVNTLLRAIGATEVMSLALADMDQRAQGALEVISEQARIVQMEGWHFNQEFDTPLTPGTDKRITLPSNLARLTVSEKSADMRVAQRGLALYDLKNRTPFFEKPVYVNMTLLFEFAMIPPAIRWLIVAQAGRIYGVNRKPDNGTYRFTKEVEEMARAAALSHDVEERDGNLPDLSPHFRNMRRR